MVKRLFRNGRNIMLRQQKTILSAAFILSSTYVVSALLGLVRDRLLAHYFGDSEVLGIYFAADRIPNLIFSLLVIGAISSAFIPVFTKYMKKNLTEAYLVSSSVINLTLALFLIISILVYIYAGPVSKALTLSKLDSSSISLMVKLMRIMLFAQIILIVSNFLTSTLQSFRHFFIPALAPVIYNLGIIISLIFFTKSFGIVAPALGMVLGSLGHLLIQIPLLSAIKFRYFFSFNLKHSGVREIIRLVLPRTLGLAGNQISYLINTSLAIFISTPSLVSFNFAQHLQNMPIALFGGTIAQAALPTLSMEVNERNHDSFKKILLTTFHQMSFLTIPMAVVLLILRIPIVRLVFGAASFSWGATLTTSYTLAFFSFGIFAQSAVFLLSRAFYALHDTKTPVLTSLGSIVLNILLSIYFVRAQHFGVWSLGLSFALGSVVNFVALFILLDKRVGYFERKALFKPFIKISYSAVLMGIFLYLPMKLLDELVLDTTRTINLLALTFIAGGFGLLVYLLFTKLLNVYEVEMIYKLARRLNLKNGYKKL